MITHYDLFAGIGGFSYALDTIFNDHEIKHIFCEWEQFPTAVLKKHWPDGTYYGDIADLVADTNHTRSGASASESLPQDRAQNSQEREHSQYGFSGQSCTVADTKRQRWEGEPRHTEGQHRLCDRSGANQNLTILTGGFPCQPFSHAGRRQGTSDDRYKWPEMFAVIRNVRPDWVIAENVRGLASWNDGMVLETVCADLESEGYEVRPYIIPACSKGAPHRRERVWIVAHASGDTSGGKVEGVNGQADEIQKGDRKERSGSGESSRADGVALKRSEGWLHELRGVESLWNKDWREVALATCHDGVDDGLPRRLDGATLRGKRTDTISASKHRQERLKACGNAIVPQVAMEIFEAIKNTNHPNHD